MPKKDYVKNAKQGDILNQSGLKDFLDQSKTYNIKIEVLDKTNKDYKIVINGKISDMKYSNNFEDTVLEFIKEQKKFNEEQKKFNEEQKKFNEEQKKFNKEQQEHNKKVDKRLDNIEKRLDNVEKDIKEMKSTPTMKSELKQLSKASNNNVAKAKINKK